MGDFPHNRFLQREGLLSAYSEFMGDLKSGLRLSGEDAAAVENVHPNVWTPILVSTMSGEAQDSFAISERTDQLIPPAAQPLLGGVVEYDGIPHLNFSMGRLADTFEMLHKAPDAISKTRFERVSEAGARFLFALGAVAKFDKNTDWGRSMPINPQTIVRFDKSGSARVMFSSTTEDYPIEGPVRSVVSYGPGLTVSQVANEMRGQVVDFYLVSGGPSAHFVTAFTRLVYKRMTKGAAKSSDPRANKPPEAYYYKEGIKASIGEVATKAARKGDIDVVLMSAVHSAGPNECVAGVEGAHRLLRVGGLFVVKAPDVSLTGEAGLDIVTPAAESFFGSPVAAGACGSNAQFIDPTLPLRRSASYAIYKKQ